MIDRSRGHKVVTCILAAGDGVQVLERLHKIGVNSAFVHHARGVGGSGKRRRGASYYAEREVITVLVDPERADEVFEFLYHAAGINRPHGGLLLMEKAPLAVPLLLPDLPEES